MRRTVGLLLLGLLVATPAAAQQLLSTGKRAVQSGIGAGGVASRAVDGNTNGNWAGASVSHTDRRARAWWMVDLGTEQLIESITIYNRTDCCSDRLDNFSVRVTNQETANPAGLAAAAMTFSYRHGAAGRVIEIPVGGKAGRYVYVVLDGNNYLQLAEVEVRGRAMCGGEGQPRCEFTHARAHGKPAAPGGGEFLNPLTGEYVSCPAGYKRSVNPDINAPTACHLPARENGRPGRFIKNNGCAAGQFADPNGNCYSCPANAPNRNMEPVTSSRSCEKVPVFGPFAKATNHGSAGCPAGSFLDIGLNKCYSCDGWTRSAAPVTAGNACTTVVPERWAPIASRRPAGCTEGTFLDVGRGDCWSCPADHNRSVHPVDGAQACTIAIGMACKDGLVDLNGTCLRRGECGMKDGRPCLLVERIPSCDAGLAEDFVNNKCIRSPTVPELTQTMAPYVEALVTAAVCLVDRGVVKAIEQSAQSEDRTRVPPGPGIDQCAADLRETLLPETRSPGGGGGDVAKTGTITVGISGSAVVGIGANSEIGVAFDLAGQRPAYWYSSLGYSFGVSAPALGLTVSFYSAQSDSILGTGSGLSWSYPPPISFVGATIWVASEETWKTTPWPHTGVSVSFSISATDIEAAGGFSPGRMAQMSAGARRAARVANFAATALNNVGVTYNRVVTVCLGAVDPALAPQTPRTWCK